MYDPNANKVEPIAAVFATTVPYIVDSMTYQASEEQDSQLLGAHQAILFDFVEQVMKKHMERKYFQMNV